MTEVYVYSAVGCQPCMATKRWLERNNIAYKTVDVTDRPDKVEHLRDQGHHSLPVVVSPIGKWSGFRPDMLGKLL